MASNTATRYLVPDVGRGFMLLLIAIAHAPLSIAFTSEPRPETDGSCACLPFCSLTVERLSCSLCFLASVLLLPFDVIVTKACQKAPLRKCSSVDRLSFCCLGLFISSLSGEWIFSRFMVLLDCSSSDSLSCYS